MLIAGNKRSETLKTRVLSEEARKAQAFLKRLSGKDGVAAGKTFPPETYRYELSQVQILAALLNRIYARELLPLHGLPLMEWRLLEAIGLAPGITAAEFAQYWVYDKVTVSRALQTLKNRGLIESGPHATDKRRIELRLTEEGQAAFGEQLDAKNRQLEALTGVLTDEEMSSFTSLTRQLIDHFRRVDKEIGQ
ncbi:MarR family winged helix-turn-helix transcriptional regulator [Caballeronia sp. 15711]|jgi:DNA-binding MarR family transcriptional regulator|uniref:MarR family winged helix-turn-helix transcriptional regulator n=1 Tax=Caballeronia sp. 15711 TaxID=3391029 RepID=UPI0039E56973